MGLLIFYCIGCIIAAIWAVYRTIDAHDEFTLGDLGICIILMIGSWLMVLVLVVDFFEEHGDIILWKRHD